MVVDAFFGLNIVTIPIYSSGGVKAPKKFGACRTFCTVESFVPGPAIEFDIAPGGVTSGG